jgi:hypothetical protein
MPNKQARKQRKVTSRFSTKHYRILAQAIAESREYAIKRKMRTDLSAIDAYRTGVIKANDILIMHLVNIFERDNPRFNRTTFITAAVSAEKL